MTPPLVNKGCYSKSRIAWSTVRVAPAFVAIDLITPLALDRRTFCIFMAYK